MRYRLRTLLILLAVGPPLLSAPWTIGPLIPREAAAVLSILFALGFLTTMAAASLAVPFLIGWVFSLIANGLIRLLVSQENRR